MNSLMKNNFSYDSIRSSYGEIRVVVLAQSSKASTPIHCDLFTVSLDNEIEYEALSYVWGDQNLSSKIYLGKEIFCITPNLESALRHLRLPDRSRVLWIDFICINQNSLKERAEQVALMGRIYKSACWDVLWMGSDIENYRYALPVLEHQFSEYEGQAYEEFASLVQKSNGLAWNQLISFFQSQVWQRMWIVQELVLAKEIFVFCSSKYLPYSSIKCVARLLISPRYIDRIPVEAYRGSAQLANIAGIHYWRNRGGLDDLLTLWYPFGWSKCQNVRDKIYALLNIVSDNLDIHPDYGVTPQELFIGVTRRYILQQQDLKILGYAWNVSPSAADHQILQKLQLGVSNMSTKEQLYTLPTWCVDFGSDDQPYCARFFFERSKDPKIKSYIPWVSACSNLLENSKDLSKLCLLGVTLDHVRTVSKGTRGWQPAQIIEQYNQRIPETLQNPKSKYFNGDTLKQAYWITVLCGMARLSQDNWNVQRVQSSTALEKAQPKTKRFGLGGLFGKKTVQPSNLTADDYALARAAESHLNEDVLESTKYSVFCTTNEGYMALAPDDTKPGDLICALYGGCTPFILRPASGQNKERLLTLIGPAYVHGFMDGLPLAWRDQGILKEERFIIV